MGDPVAFFENGLYVLIATVLKVKMIERQHGDSGRTKQSHA